MLRKVGSCIFSKHAFFIPATFVSLHDPFMCCSNHLNDEQKQLSETVRIFADKELAPIAAKIDKTDEFPHELWPKMGEMGLLGPTVPQQFGGLGLTYLEHILIMEQLSRVSASVGLSYGAHSNLCIQQLCVWGTMDQKHKYLPKLVEGTYIGALAMSECDAGSDVLSMSATAVADGDDYIINGTKMWCTNGSHADIIIVYVKTGEKNNKKNITAFIIEKNIEGFFTGKKLDKLGMRGSTTSELIFKSCKVSKNQILGEFNNGLKVLMSGLNSERLVLSAGPVGIMQACMDVVLSYVNTRKQFGQYIGDFQLVQGKLADMYVTLVSHRLFLYSMARAFSEGAAGRADCAAVILSCAEKSTWMALQAIQLLGGNGYTNEFPTGRFLRDAKLYEIGAGTSEIRRMLIGKELNKFYRKTQ